LKPETATKLKHVLFAVGSFLTALAASGVIPGEYLGYVTGIAGLLTGVALPAPGSLVKGDE
jgi:hypothetical protein